MPLNYTVRCTKDDRYRVIRVATGEERGVYDTYGEAASCQDALEQGYRAACQVTGAPLIEPAARESTTTDRLLELAYDLEQQGKLSLAAGLRRMAHDPLFFAEVTRVLAEREPVVEHPMILAARAYDQAPTPEHYAAMAREWEAAGLPMHSEHDDPIETVISTERGITCTRVDSAPDRAWLSFTIGTKGEDGRILVDLDIVGGRPGCDLLIWGEQINDEPMTLDQLRQIHADLGAMLADERLLGALAGQPA